MSLATVVELDEQPTRDVERLPEPTLLELIFGHITTKLEEPAEGWVKD